MRVTICGHAMLFVETSDHRILIDPYFSNTLLNGALVYNPSRVLAVDKIPIPTILVVTHEHFDHLDWDSLARLPHEIPLITANEPSVVKQLKNAGFTNVITCDPWHVLQFGKTKLTATPSDHEEEEVGLLIEDEDSRFWHMVDSEVTVETGYTIAKKYGSIDLISAKHQPSVSAMIGYLKNMGAEFNKQEVVTWLESACVCDPKLVFPYASGICFNDRHAWFNRYAFPLSAEEIVRLVQRRLGAAERATTVLPGDIIELQPGKLPQKHEQASPFVQSVPLPPVVWEPVDTSTLAGLDTAAARAELDQRLNAVLTKPLTLWLERKVQQGNNAIAEFCYQEMVWQLIVHAGDGERLNYFIDFRSQNFSAKKGKHPEANFFTHISGQTLDEVLKGKAPGILFWLTGSVRSYEKILGVADGNFWFPKLPDTAEHRMSDPLTYYLRHFGSGAMSPNEPDLSGIEWTKAEVEANQVTATDVDVLVREGGNHAVLSKKALLTYLSLQEADRIGLEVTHEDIQMTSDAFRYRFGLLESNDIDHWLAEVGISLDEYTEMIHSLSTVMKVENHHTNLIQPLLLKHRQIATATAHLNNAG